MNAYTSDIERMMKRLFDSLRENDRRRYAAIEVPSPSAPRLRLIRHRRGISQEYVIPEGTTRSRAFRFHVARPPATPTRPSRGPWLAIGLCCSDRSSLTTASSEPRNPSPTLMDSRRSLLHPRKSASGGNPEVPQLTPRDCARVPPPLPRWPQRVPMTVASSRVFAFTSQLRVRRPRWSFRGCRVHSELRVCSINRQQSPRTGAEGR
jgi:hypothetical protein